MKHAVKWEHRRSYLPLHAADVCEGATYYILISKMGDERPVTVNMAEESEAKEALAGAAVAVWTSPMAVQTQLLGIPAVGSFFALAKARRGCGVESVKRLVPRKGGYLWADDPATCAVLQRRWGAQKAQMN